MSNWNGKTIIITGASSGIGEATAERFVKEGANVVLAARREDRLKELQDKLSGETGKAVYKKTDVTSEKEMKELAEFAINEFGQIDVLFNNAGLMPLSFMKNTKVDEWDKMVDVNIKGVLYGVAAVLPHMIERNEGHILTTSSVAGHEVMPTGAVYCGTKFAARIIMEGMGKELAESNIRTTSISPGVVQTELTDTITDEDAMSFLKDGVGLGSMTPLASEDIAEGVFYAVNQPAHVDVNEIIIRPTNQG
ncbi:NADP-dependent 3-hydroxy acid dehydrogenase YdfG [Sinobaca qinghaiensis]|uniref:NADP-dependent 3-hydroxy acid dehydrogenase YdfG n=1 Tax=Sinobaca qinghaiensis TaxID=342944 RepID=A0A419UXA8_9BACL|nr:SDR family oxidoreductase [Sinobaca qinghaiensis]RKD69767.1 NADP-dependent 3-hydroxy acid dehydrogenase YdfG [Sinobaca qinghaiensis]